MMGCIRRLLVAISGRQMRATLAVLMILALFVGCNRTKARLSKPPDFPETAHWPALDDLSMSRNGIEKLIRSVAIGSYPAVRGYLTSDEFRQMVANFENEPIPKKYATPEREAAKARAVEILRKLIADANGATNEDIATGAQALSEAILDVHKIPD